MWILSLHWPLLEGCSLSLRMKTVLWSWLWNLWHTLQVTEDSRMLYRAAFQGWPMLCSILCSAALCCVFLEQLNDCKAQKTQINGSFWKGSLVACVLDRTSKREQQTCCPLLCSSNSWDALNPQRFLWLALCISHPVFQLLWWIRYKNP